MGLRARAERSRSLSRKRRSNNAGIRPEREGQRPAQAPQIGLIHKGFSPRCAHRKRGITACGRRIGAIAMRGKRCAGLRPCFCPPLSLGPAPPPPRPRPPRRRPARHHRRARCLEQHERQDRQREQDRSRRDRARRGGRQAYGDRLSFGLVAFGHRKASNCADSEIVAKPGELTAETQGKLLDKIKPKGQAPIAAALSDAAKAQAQGRARHRPHRRRRRYAAMPIFARRPWP